MASTRRIMHVIEGSKADADLVADVLGARSEADSAMAFTLLREALPEDELLMLANLRAILAEMPDPPFRAGNELAILERAGGYEDTGRSCRKLFLSGDRVFGVEFVGRGSECEGIFVHTPSGRFAFGGDEVRVVDEVMVALLADNAIVLDAIIEALELLEWPLEPAIYLTADDFLAEHGAAAASSAIGVLFE
jgi:hypothetical protein